jgi:hypothetical protein
VKPTSEQLLELLKAVLSTEPEEIDCEEFLSRVAAYLETLERGTAPSPELRLVSQHLNVCPGCREEFQALLELHGQADDAQD